MKLSDIYNHYDPVVNSVRQFQEFDDISKQNVITYFQR